MMQAPLELVGLGSSSSMDSFASWKMNGSRMEKEEREEMPLQGEDESRRSSIDVSAIGTCRARIFFINELL